MKATFRFEETGTGAKAGIAMGGRLASIEDVVLAATQKDEELATAYREILSQVAYRLRVEIVQEFDGDKDAGCHWYAVKLYAGHGWDTPVTRPIEITNRQYKGTGKGKRRSPEDQRDILAKCVEIGLGDAVFGWNKKVSDAVRA